LSTNKDYRKSCFIGEIVTQWLTGTGRDREMELLEDFTFIDPYTKAWTVPAGFRFDGAGIPSPLWSFYPGPPFVGDYRRANVLHEYFLEKPGNNSMNSIHRMFYHAMIVDGVSPGKAKLMYLATRILGDKAKYRLKRAAGLIFDSITDPDIDLNIDSIDKIIQEVFNRSKPG